MMAFVAALLFVLFGLLALVADIGIASLASARLESAADRYALERLRVDASAEPIAAELDGARSRDGFVLPAPVAVREDADGDGVDEIGFEQAIPLLFGHGTLLHFADGRRSIEAIRAARIAGEATPQLASGGLRERGIALRAVREERFAPVVRVGVAIADDVPGRADFALRVSCWPRLAAAQPGEIVRIDLALAPGESGALVLVEVSPAGAIVGPACAEDAGFALAPADGVTWVGDTLDRELVRSTALAPAATALAYVPLLAADDRVVAFAPASVTFDEGRLAVKRGADPIAQGNASAVLTPPQSQADADRLERARETLADRGLALMDGDPGILRAPTLATAEPTP